MMNARILVWNHGVVTSGQRTASADGPRTEGERMLAAYLDERSVPWRYECFGEGVNPDFRADHPAAGEVVLEVYEPEYLLRATRTGPIVPGLLPRRDAWCSGGLPLAGNHGRLQSHATWASRSCSSSPARTVKWLSTGTTFPWLFGSPEFQWSPRSGPGRAGTARVRVQRPAAGAPQHPLLRHSPHSTRYGRYTRRQRPGMPGSRYFTIPLPRSR